MVLLKSGLFFFRYCTLDWPSLEILEDCTLGFKTAASFGDLMLSAKQVEPTPFETSVRLTRVLIPSDLNISITRPKAPPPEG